MSLVEVRFLKETYINIKTPTRVFVGQHYDVPADMAAGFVEKGTAEYVAKVDPGVNIDKLLKDDLVKLATEAGVEKPDKLTVKQLKKLLKELSETE